MFRKGRDLNDAASIGERSSPRASTLPVLAKGALPGLDGLRAISVMFVMFSHYGYGKLVPGALGVTIFFFLSGFLITTLLLREMAVTGRLDIRAFFMRRLLRLGPELLGLIIVSGLAGAIYIGLPRPADVLAALFYVSNYYKILSDAGFFTPDIRWPHLWSLAVELHFYLVYPFLFIIVIGGARKFIGALSLVCVLTLAWRCYVMWRFGAGLFSSQYIPGMARMRLRSSAARHRAFLMLSHPAALSKL